MIYTKGKWSMDLTLDQRLKLTNICYLIYFVIIACISFALYNSGYQWLGKIINTEYTEPKQIGLACVVRTTFPLALWFLIHSIICVRNPNLEDSWQFIFHTQYIFLHFIAEILLWVVCWFIPDDFFDIYVYVAMGASGIYLFLQICFLIDFFMELNSKMLNMTSKNGMRIAISAFFEIVSLAAFGVSYYMFTVNGCGNNSIVISVNMFVCICLFVLSIFTERGSIFTSSLISCYVAFLTVTGMMCQPHCNRWASGGQTVMISIVASLFTLIWGGYSCFSSTTQLASCLCTTTDSIFSLSFFHGLYALASVYVTMVVSHWGKVEEGAQWTTERGSVSKYVNFADSWMTMLLYFWSLIAPHCLKDREFESP